MWPKEKREQEIESMVKMKCRYMQVECRTEKDQTEMQHVHKTATLPIVQHTTTATTTEERVGRRKTECIKQQHYQPNDQRQIQTADDMIIRTYTHRQQVVTGHHYYQPHRTEGEKERESGEADRNN